FVQTLQELGEAASSAARTANTMTRLMQGAIPDTIGKLLQNGTIPVNVPDIKEAHRTTKSSRSNKRSGTTDTPRLPPTERGLRQRLPSGTTAGIKVRANRWNDYLLNRALQW